MCRHVIRLAPGIALRCDTRTRSTMRVLAPGKAQLNQPAFDILELCDGSRNRDRVVADAMTRSLGCTRRDVVEFLAAAELRGWITEGE